MTAITEGRHGLEFLISEASHTRSRDTVTILSGQGKLKAGTVLGRKTVAGAASAAKAGGNTGGGTLTLDATDPVRPNAKAGVYKVRAITLAANGGVFSVVGPDGVGLGTVKVGDTYDDQLKFVLADSGTDFALGDGFDITVDAGSLKYVASPATGEDGSEQACAILGYNVDATSNDVKVLAITRQAEVNINNLEYAASVDDDSKKAAKVAQLATNRGIIAR